MIIRGSPAPKAKSQEIYNTIERRQVRRGITISQKRRKVQSCHICGENIRVGSMKRHLLRQHDIKYDSKYQCRQVGATGTFQIDKIIRGESNECPIPGCSGGGKDRSTFYRHFCYRHPDADIVVKEDGELEKCESCGLRCINLQRHKNSKTCKQLTQRRRNELLQDLQAQANHVSFNINGKQIERVSNFRYLGRIISEDGDDTKSIKDNIKRARHRWNRLAQILKREGANPICMSRFYRTIIQAVLLYGADSWTISERNLNLLRSFHWRTVRHITGSHIQKITDKKWSYPDHEQLLKKCQLFPMDVYLERRRGTLRDYFNKYRKDLFEELQSLNHHCYASNKKFWWEQPWMTKSSMRDLQRIWDSK